MRILVVSLGKHTEFLSGPNQTNFYEYEKTKRVDFNEACRDSTPISKSTSEKRPKICILTLFF